MEPSGIIWHKTFKLSSTFWEQKPLMKELKTENPKGAEESEIAVALSLEGTPNKLAPY